MHKTEWSSIKEVGGNLSETKVVSPTHGSWNRIIKYYPMKLICSELTHYLIFEIIFLSTIIFHLVELLFQRRLETRLYLILLYFIFLKQAYRLRKNLTSVSSAFFFINMNIRVTFIFHIPALCLLFVSQTSTV